MPGESRGTKLFWTLIGKLSMAASRVHERRQQPRRRR